jgi:type VII secretion integral membrane protein EccD
VTNLEERNQHRTTTPTRLRLVVGSGSVELALPSDVPLLDLLPAVLARLGPAIAEEGVGHEGWVLQRLGEQPLDEARSPAQLHLLDGETVYLRPRSDQLPLVDWDDLVDGIAEEIRTRSNIWTPRKTRWMLLAGAAAVLLIGLVLLVGTGRGELTAAFGGVAAAVSLLCAAVVSRVRRDPVTATVLAGVGLCYATTSAWFSIVALDPPAGLAVRLAAATLAALAAIVIGLAGVADAALLFVGALLCVVLLAVPSVIAVVGPADSQQAAAIGLLLSVVVAMFVPASAFKLGGLTLPALPTSAPELQEDIDPVPYQLVVDRTAAAAGYQTSLHCAVGAAQVPLVVVLASGGGMWPLVTAAVVALLLLLRARHLGGAVQRWSMLVPAGVTVTVEIFVLAHGQPLFVRLAEIWAPSLVVALGLFVASDKLPNWRLRPYWGRAVEIFETLTAVALVPLLLAVLNVYALMRGLAG